MIGIIGSEDDVIGFGLAGVNNMMLLRKNADKEEIFSAITQLQAKTILITEELYSTIQEDARISDLCLVQIPTKDKQDEDIVAQLAKEVLGVTLP